MEIETLPIYIHILPTEVLSLIFTTIVDASLYARLVSDRRFVQAEYPTMLASVCRYWRSTALNTPGIWSSIDCTRKSDKTHAFESARAIRANYSNRLERDRSANFEHAKIYFERSQDTLLHIWMGKPVPGGKYRVALTRQWPEDIGNLIADNASRVKSVALSFSHPQDVEDMLSVLLKNGANQSLRNLGLQFEPATFRQIQASGFGEEYNQMFEPLDTLYLYQILISPWHLACCHLNELHITVFPAYLAFMSISQVAQILESNPGLRVFKLSTRATIADVPTSPQPLHLPALRRLDLYTHQGSIMKWFLASIIPGPQEVELSLEPGGFSRLDRSVLKDAVALFLQRAQVKMLHIAGGWILLPPILVHTPRIRHLRLTLYDIENGSLDGIELLRSNLADLHTIEMNECHTKGNDAQDPGLRAIFTLPSARMIRHYQCAGTSHKARQLFHKLLEGDQKVVEAPDFGFELYPSLLLPPSPSG
ncbi:F-box-like protein [Ceratobasidium sp. AG-Ba]|nr:F-box-like protein [Ceratobasidium sp. AG-Ba]